MATTADARTRARRIVEEALAAAEAASPSPGGDPNPVRERAAGSSPDRPAAPETGVATAGRVEAAALAVGGPSGEGPPEVPPTARQIAHRIAQAALLAYEERQAGAARPVAPDVDENAAPHGRRTPGADPGEADAPAHSEPAKGADPAEGVREEGRPSEPSQPSEPAVAAEPDEPSVAAEPTAPAANGHVDGDRTRAVALARRIVAEVMAEEEARAEAAEAEAAAEAAALAAALARAADEADAAADAAAAEAVARAADGLPVPEPVPAPDPLPRPEPFPDPSPDPGPAPDPSPPDPSPDPFPPDPSPDPFPPDPPPDPLPPDPFPPEPEPAPVSEGGRGSSVPVAVPVASVDLFPTVTQPTDVGFDEPTVVSGDEPTVVANGQTDLTPDEVTRELPAEPAAPSGPPPLPLEVVSGWWRKRRAVRQRQRAMAEWAPDATERPRRTGRWLVATIVMVVAIALLFPLAVDALRQLVAL